MTVLDSERAPAAASPARDRTGRDLSAQAAAVAVRVAELVEANCTAESARSAVAFLRSWAGGTGAATATAADAPSPLDRLVSRYRLSAVARDLLVLAGLPEEHEGLAGTFRILHPRGEPRPTLGLAALLADLDGASRAQVRRLRTTGGLIGEGLVRLDGDGPLFERSLVVAPALWDALHGDDAWPDRLESVAIESTPPGLDGWLRLPAVRRAVAALCSPSPRSVVLACADEAVALSRCAAMAAASGIALVAARVEPGEAEGARLLAAHAAVRGALPVFCATGDRCSDGPPAPSTMDLTWLPGPALVCAPPGGLRPVGRRPVLHVPPGPIGLDDQRRAWSQNVPQLGADAAALAARHPLDPALTAVVGADLTSGHQLGATTDLADVAAAIRSRACIALPPGVSLSTPTVTWDDVVLPEEPTRQLRDAVDRLSHQRLVLEEWGFGARAGRGVRMLFTGPPGTGKSLAAAAVAHAAETDLLVVDVAHLVSKWIGETEKNLAGAFDAAERTQAVLLLDEADVLFGTRTQIKTSNDRYANLETAYLLQRMEVFDGLIVLTTNLRQNIDAAFLRRVDFLVEFGLPDAEHRALLWRRHLPARARLADDVDLEVLARMYPVPGAWIRNAALAAAFLAAPAGGPITRDQLLCAMRREYAKAARPYPGEPPPGLSETQRGET